MGNEGPLEANECGEQSGIRKERIQDLCPDSLQGEKVIGKRRRRIECTVNSDQPEVRTSETGGGLIDGTELAMLETVGPGSQAYGEQ